MRFAERVSNPGISGQRLTLPAELEDGRIPARIGFIASYISVLLICALVWGSFAQIRELVVAPGRIIPSGRVQQIQHLEGGEVEKVVAIEGQIVEPGAALLHLRPTAATSDLNQLEVRSASLQMRQIALTALLGDTTPDFGKLANKYPDLAAQEHHVYNAKKTHSERERQALAARVAQKKSEVRTLVLEEQSLQRQKEIQKEQLGIRSELLKDGYTSRRAYLSTKTAFEEVSASHISVAGRLETTKSQLVEVTSKLHAFEAETRKTLSQERFDASAELAELREKLGKHRDRVDRLVVRSPIRGIVQELAQAASGEVVSPGDLVARVVPVDRHIVAEVRVNPRDIGHVKEGDEVEVKLSTFDPSIFGVAKGKLGVLSATTFTDEEGKPYFKGVILLEKNYVGQGDKRRMILPGMVVDANIITGSKSLIRYILKPVYRSLDRAFTER
jgi:HlyD family secretion protein/adhesin transport system membrane fusion protein